MTKQDTIDLNLLIATFRCFHEQLYNLKGRHSKIVKLKFNRLIGVARAYENEVIKLTGESPELEEIYNQLMEIILTVKEQVK
jgi:molybdenum cofactor biosynthesis enzyme MoaA